MKQFSPSLEPHELINHVERYLNDDPQAKEIATLQTSIKQKRREVIEMESTLTVLEKTRPKISIPYRDSIMWCLQVDSTNPYYFLKSKQGLVKCVEYKHKAKLTTGQKNALGSVLSMMYNERKIGRISHFDMYFYGLPEMFEKDGENPLTELKEDYKQYVNQLRQVNV